MNLNRFQKKEPRHDLLIMGYHAVKELLLHAPERFIRIFLEEEKKHSGGEKRKEILEICQKKKIAFEFVSKNFLEKISGSEFHQSVVGEIKERNYLNLKQFLNQLKNQETSIVLMVDQIFDPQNLGALIRSCECFGVDGIVWSKNRGVDITPAVAKASCGASEILPLVRVSNLVYTIEEFQKEGFEAIVTLLDEKAQNGLEFSFPPKTLLIAGSEGEGVQPLIQKKADHSLYIPMKGKIGSLNVSNATAIFLALYSKLWP